MEEFEIFAEVVILFEDAEEGAANLELTDMILEGGSAVEDMAEAPAISEFSDSQSVMRNFIEHNRYGRIMWKVSKTISSEVVKNSIVFGIIYGLNKGMAKKSYSNGKKISLHSYLRQVEINFNKNHLKWDSAVRDAVINGALSMPWISREG
jgi:hypothetical protein